VDRTCGGHGIKEKCLQILVVKPEGKGPLGTCRKIWKNNIKMEPKGRVGMCGLN
jgi:hypothetical protein